MPRAAVPSRASTRMRARPPPAPPQSGSHCPHTCRLYKRESPSATPSSLHVPPQREAPTPPLHPWNKHHIVHHIARHQTPSRPRLVPHTAGRYRKHHPLLHPHPSLPLHDIRTGYTPCPARARIARRHPLLIGARAPHTASDAASPPRCASSSPSIAAPRNASAHRAIAASMYSSPHARHPDRRHHPHRTPPRQPQHPVTRIQDQPRPRSPIPCAICRRNLRPFRLTSPAISTPGQHRERRRAQSRSAFRAQPRGLVPPAARSTPTARARRPSSSRSRRPLSYATCFNGA